MLNLKPLSDCHEFGYDMRRVKNSPHVVEKSKRCRPMSAVLVTCRHISYIVVHVVLSRTISKESRTDVVELVQLPKNAPYAYCSRYKAISLYH